MFALWINIQKQLTILLFIGLFSVATLAEVGPNWIEQWGIRWTFNKEISPDGAGDTYQYGQYVTGDYWIVGPVVIKQITPECITGPYGEEGEIRTMNGSMINPSSLREHGYDSARGAYNDNLNVALTGKLPLKIPSGSSLISAISREASRLSLTGQLDYCAILTVVNESPREGSFRPSYCSPDKSSPYNKADIKWDVLKELSPVPGTPTPESLVGSYLAGPWIDHNAGASAANVMPGQQIPSYGRDIMKAVGQIALVLNIDQTTTQEKQELTEKQIVELSRSRKQELLIKFIQVGIDLYGVLKRDLYNNTGKSLGGWSPDGGITQGRKLPILFAGMMLDDNDMKAIGQRSGAYLTSQKKDEQGNPIEGEYYRSGNPPPDYYNFGEDGQTFYVSQFHVDYTNNLIDGLTYAGSHPFETDDIGRPEWSTRDSYAPKVSHDYWPISYRRVAGGQFTGLALTAHIMGIKELWNHPAFFDYTDRYWAERIASGWYGTTNDPSTFVTNMWNTYRADYGPIWPETTDKKPVRYPLTIIFDIEKGNVTPDGGIYDGGTEVRLVATANEGYRFVGWNGGVSDSNNPITTILMDDNKTINVRFEKIMTSSAIYKTNHIINGDQEISTTGWNLDGMTIALWAKADNLAGTHYLLGHMTDSSSNLIELYIQDGQVGLGLGDNHALHQNIHTIEVGRWYFIALCLDFSNYAVYVDDELKAQGTYTGLIEPSKIAYIGNNGVRTEKAFNGTIDAVQVYGSPLDIAQIQSIYRHGPNKNPTAHWPLSEPHQNTPVDIVNGKGASLINNPEWIQVSKGKYIVHLDGTQAMQIPMSNCQPESGTIALWIQPEINDSMQILFGHAVGSSDNRIALYLAAGNLALEIGNTLQSDICHLVTNQFYHVAVTWDDTNYAVFVDGDQKTSGVFNGLSRLDATADVGNYGIPENRTSGLGFCGLLENVQLYSYALDTEAINALSLTHYVRENRPLEFIVGGVDQQGYPVSYTTQNLPQGATFDAVTQTFSWQPSLYNKAGNYSIVFTDPSQTEYIVFVSVLNANLTGNYRCFLEYLGKD